MATLLGALLRNESGGRNVANTHQGTSSGQAQGYFQITTGTWNDFGGQKYASNPMQASYEQQAEIASKIPLKRWDKSTLAAMRATGRPIDPSRTLGENLAMHGESFGGGGGQAAAPPQAAQPRVMDGPKGQEQIEPAGYSTRPQGPVEAAGGGRGADPLGIASLFSNRPGGPVEAAGGGVGSEAGMGAVAAPQAEQPTSLRDRLGEALLKGGKGMMAGGFKPFSYDVAPQPAAARVNAGSMPVIDPQQAEMQRQQLAQVMARLNAGRLV
ncbi:transglycosylase family protein [Mesorhizobium sp. M1409]|uniref:transglycosylase family protein n=1 Tax=Mesorhizobium sp. M1409 TaxID=2957100 RepID=UPI003338E9BE